MASVNWKKLHGGGETAAMLNHADRREGDTRTHSNPDIDPKRINENYVVGRWRFSGNTAYEAQWRLSDWTKEIDATYPPTRIRKDRVTAISFNVSVPYGTELTPEQERRFFRICRDEIASMCSGYATPGYVHRDEIHAYKLKNPATGAIEERKSLPHMHMVGLPYVPGKGLNGKAFETRQAINALNRAIDDRCRQELGIRFMTQEPGPHGKNTKDMKRDSATLAREELRGLKTQIRDTRNELDGLTEKRDSVRSEVADLTRIRDDLLRNEEIKKRIKREAQQRFKVKSEYIDRE